MPHLHLVPGELRLTLGRLQDANDRFGTGVPKSAFVLILNIEPADHAETGWWMYVDILHNGKVVTVAVNTNSVTTFSDPIT